MGDKVNVKIMSLQTILKIVFGGSRTDIMRINQSPGFVCRKVDQRAGQLSLLHVGITKTERNLTKT